MRKITILKSSAHAKELGNSVPKAPILFLKPTTSYLLQNQGPILLPNKAQCHYEVELGVVIGSSGKKIGVSDAMNHVGGYVLAIDASFYFKLLGYC